MHPDNTIFYLIWSHDKGDKKWYLHNSEYDYETFFIAHVIKKRFFIIHEDVK